MTTPKPQGQPDPQPGEQPKPALFDKVLRRMLKTPPKPKKTKKPSPKGR